MPPVVPPENPPSGLRTLHSGRAWSGDAKAAGRVKLEDTGAFPQRVNGRVQFRAPRGYKYDYFVGAEAEEDCLKPTVINPRGKTAHHRINLIAPREALKR